MYGNALLIPSLNPPDAFVPYVRDLRAAGFSRIIVVDDGSREEFKGIFETLKNECGCTVLVHEVNQGKGRGLKDGFLFALRAYGEDPAFRGVITADSDGQHTVRDVIRLNDLLDAAAEPTLYLGSRNFDLDIVPARSRKGNKITSTVFRLLYGKSVNDTQTGLRAISRELLPEYAALDGDRFEYEMNMLIHAAKKKQPIVEEPIETVYIDNNSESHFHPVIDSFRIYRLILGKFFLFLVSSLLSTLIDQGLANLFFYVVFGAVKEFAFPAKAAARVISASCNFLINRKVVFASSGNTGKQVIRFIVLAVGQLLLSASLVHALMAIPGIPAWMFTIFSMVVDTVLFVLSYTVQKHWVFREK